MLGSCAGLLVLLQVAHSLSKIKMRKCCWTYRKDPYRYSESTHSPCHLLVVSNRVPVLCTLTTYSQKLENVGTLQAWENVCVTMYSLS